MPVEIGYFTIAVPDVNKGAAFYGSLFGWTFDLWQPALGY